MNNLFNKCRAIWGACFDIELYYYVRSENNIFQGGISKQYAYDYVGEPGIGSGSALMLLGIINETESQYIGYNNQYLDNYSENMGKFKRKIYLLV